MNNTKMFFTKMKKVVAVLAVLGSTAVAFADNTPDPAASWHPQKIVVFGDGYSDDSGHYTNGPTWTSFFAANENVIADPTAAANTSDFQNYARGDSVILKMDETQTKTTLFDQQIMRFLSTKSVHSSETLAVFWVGANDLMASPCYEKPFTCVDSLIKDVKKNMITVYGTGVRHFILISVPDITETPSLKKNNNSDIQKDIAELVKYYNHNLALLSYQFTEQHSEASAMFIESQEIFDSIISQNNLQTDTPCYDNEAQGKPCTDTSANYFYWNDFYPTTNVYSLFADSISKKLDTDWDDYT